MTKIERINQALLSFYEGRSVSKHLEEAIQYSIQAGGKRIRPLLFLELLEGYGATLDVSAYQTAASLEMVHTGSLIHDDLPAMDNDDYRRGVLTNHKVYGEAEAILAGDSLFLDTFTLLMQTNYPDKTKVALALALSQASGTYGMVGGQSLDMASEGELIDRSRLEAIHSHKTGKLLQFPFVAVGIVLELSSVERNALYEAGRLLGLAFQIRDDILDVTADFNSLGKTPNKDVVEEKATYPSLLGLEHSYQLLNETLDQVLKEQEKFSSTGEFSSPTFISLVEGLRLDDKRTC